MRTFRFLHPGFGHPPLQFLPGNFTTQTTNVIVASTTVFKEKVARSGRGGVLLDLLRPDHSDLLIMLEREDRKAEQFRSLKPRSFLSASTGSACLTGSTVGNLPV